MEDDEKSADPFDLAGRTFSHYRVLRRIGSGGVGWVYEAEDTRLGRLVALKILQPWSKFDEKARERFTREARAASSLNHPHTCTVFEFDEFEGRPYLTMELVDGPSLQEVIASGRMPADRARTIVGQIAAGLAHAHARGVIHRDIKPGNVLLDDSGSVKIADFGLARILDASTVTRTGSTVGTVAYMSPEQATGGEIGAASDVWSLGALYYEMLTGDRPFTGEYASAVIYQIVNGEPAGIDELETKFGQEAASVIRSCLSKSPDERPESREIAELAAPTSKPGPRSSNSEAASAIRRRTPARGIAALTVLAVLALLLIIVWINGREAPVSLRDASIALLPAEIDDDEMATALNGLIAATSKTAQSVAEAHGLVRHVVPYDSLARYSALTGKTAAARFGVSHAILFDVSSTGDELMLTLSSSAGGPPIAEERVAFSKDRLHESFGGAIRATVRLLGLPDAEQPDIPNPYAPLEPRAFDLYARAMGMIEGQESREAIVAGIELLERANERSPDFAPIYAGLGKAYLYLYDRLRDPELLETADRYCDRAIQLDTSLTDAYITYSQIHMKTGRPGMARQILGLAGKRGASSVEAKLALADIHALEGNDEEAEAAYHSALASGSGYWDVYRRAGNYYFRRSDYERAIEQYEHMVELAPLNSKAYLNLGAAHFYAGNLDLADHYWQQGMSVNPNDHQLFMNAGALYYYVGRYDRAADALERAVELNEADYVVWGNLGTAYLWSGAERDRYERTKRKAIELAEVALELNPSDVQTRAKLAGYTSELGDTTAALTHLEYFGRTPGDSEYPNETLFEVGSAWEEMGERDAALSWIRRAVENGYSLTELERYPGLEQLRQDPAFTSFMARLNREPTSPTGK